MSPIRVAWAKLKIAVLPPWNRWNNAEIRYLRVYKTFFTLKKKTDKHTRCLCVVPHCCPILLHQCWHGTANTSLCYQSKQAPSGQCPLQPIQDSLNLSNCRHLHDKLQNCCHSCWSVCPSSTLLKAAAFQLLPSGRDPGPWSLTEGDM